jgi:uncharacterized protein YacL
MKKFAISFFGVATSFLSLAGVVSAQTICPGGTFSNLCNLKLEKASGVVGNIVTILLVLAVILAIFFLIWGAIRWITSGGDKGKLDGARQAITAAIVGLILAFLAFFIINIISVIFLGHTVTTFVIPPLF